MAQFQVELAYRIDSLARELAKVEGETRAGAIKTAKARVLAEEKANDAIRVSREKTARAGTRAEKAGADASRQAIRGVADEAGDADSILKGLGGTLGTMDDSADKAAGTLGEVFAGLEAVAKVGAKVGPLGAAGAAGIAGLSLAYAALSYQLDQAIERQKQAAATADQASTAHRAFEDAILDLDVAVGNLTESERRNIKLRQQAAGVFDAQKEALREQIRATEDAANPNASLANSARRLFADYTVYGAVMESTAERQERLGAKADMLRGQLENLERGTVNLGDALIETAEANEEASQRKERAASASRAQAESERAAAQAVEEHRQRVAGLASELEALEQANAEAADADLARLEAARERLDVLEAGLAAEGMLTAEAADEILIARLNAEHTYQDAVAALQAQRQEAADREEQERIAAAERIAEKEIAEAEKVRDARVAGAKAALNAGHQLATGLIDLAIQQAEAQGATEEELAKLRKRAAIFQAIVSTAQGVAIALGSAPPPLNFANAALTAAAGAVQLALIQGSQYHRGGMIGGPTDERQITAQTGEAVLNRGAVARAGGPQGVRELNEGRQPERARGSTRLVISGRTMGRVLVDQMGSPGEARRAVRSRPVGRRN